ncbi:hypothetical protein LXL04_003011 [Taraxacum kok-saghyz]
MTMEQNLFNQSKLLKVFRPFDRDGNGVITRAELAKSMAEMGQPLMNRELTEMIEEAGTDGDGVISFSEFCRSKSSQSTESSGKPAPPFASL